MRQLSNEDIANILDMYDNEKPLNTIRETYKIGLERLKSILHENNRKTGWKAKYPINEEAFDSLSDDAAYWIGFLMADGSITNSKLSLKLSAKDEEHLLKFKDFVGAKKHKIYHTHEITELPQGDQYNSHAVSLQFHSKHIVRILNRYGIVPNKTYTASCTEDLKMNKFFWLGVIDGDGSVIKSKSPRLFLCGSDNLMTQFCDFLKSNFTWTIPPIHSENRVPQINIYGKRAVDVMTLLWSGHDLGMSRKRNIAENVIDQYQKSYRNSKIPYRGVHKSRGKYVASCNKKFIGNFETAVDAAKAYNITASEMFGGNAILNDV